MLTKPIINIYNVAEPSTQLNYNSSNHLITNQLVHIIFSSPDKTILKLEKSIIIQSFKTPICESSIEVIVHTINELIDYLQLLMTNPPNIGIENLIVADISRFYWDLKVNNVYILNTIPPLLRNIQHKYKLNVIVGSWDASFDRGYGNNTILDKSKSFVEDLSYLGTNYFNQFDEILYIDQQLRKLTHKS